MAFTKLRKWAEEKHYPHQVGNTVAGLPRIEITVSESLSFVAEYRRSEVYISGRTKTRKGNRKGMYMKTSYNQEHGLAIYYSTQQEMLMVMGEKIRDWNARQLT